MLGRMHLNVSTWIFMAATAALAGAVFQGILHPSEKWTELLAALAGGFIGAFGAYFGVRETIKADRERDERNYEREVDRVTAALREELRHIAIDVYFAARRIEEITKPEHDRSLVSYFGITEPRIFSAMASRIDLVTANQAGALVHLYHDRADLMKEVNAFGARAGPIQEEELKHLKIRAKHACTLAVHALEKFAWDQDLVDPDLSETLRKGKKLTLVSGLRRFSEMEINLDTPELTAKA